MRSVRFSRVLQPGIKLKHCADVKSLNVGLLFLNVF